MNTELDLIPRPKKNKEYKALYDIAVNSFRNGLSKEEIYIILSEDSRKITDEQLLLVINDAKKFIDDEYTKDREYMVSSHVARYNKDIEKLFNIDVSNVNKWKAKEMKNYAYFNLLETLHQKEKVLGLHTKNIQISINNKYNTKVVERKKSFDLSQLTLEEKIEFWQLLQKTKRTEDEISAIIENDDNVEDISYVEVKAEVGEQKSVEERLKEMTTPELPKSVQEEEKKNTTLLSIQDKLRASLLKEAEEKYKKAKE